MTIFERVTAGGTTRRVTWDAVCGRHASCRASYCGPSIARQRALAPTQTQLVPPKPGPHSPPRSTNGKYSAGVHQNDAHIHGAHQHGYAPSQVVFRALLARFRGMSSTFQWTIDIRSRHDLDAVHLDHFAVCIPLHLRPFKEH
jgi:hypothetical protein